MKKPATIPAGARRYQGIMYWSAQNTPKVMKVRVSIGKKDFMVK
jgi:hypothetical protein